MTLSCIALPLVTGLAPCAVQEIEHPLSDAGELTYSFQLAESEVGTEEVIFGPEGWVAIGEYELPGLAGEFAAEWARSGKTTATWHVEITRPGVEATVAGDWNEDELTSTLEAKPGALHQQHDMRWSQRVAPVFYENLVWSCHTEVALRFLELAGDELPREGMEIHAFLASNGATFKIGLTEFALRESTGETLYDFIIDASGTEMVLTTTDRGLMLRLEIPAQKVVIELEGRSEVGRETVYTSIVDSGAWREELSRPVHDVLVTSKVMIPMSDGVELAADIHRPASDGKFPAVLVRTPYGRAGEALGRGGFFARRGYALVAQDVRGRFDSQGKFVPLEFEEADGSDTIDWLAAQDWCDGNVGMIGGSYVGWVQMYAAKSGNPHLKAIVPQVCPPDPLENFPYEGGVFLMGSAWWAAVLDNMGEGGMVPDKDFTKVLATLPLTDLDEALDSKLTFLDEWLAHPPHHTEYWKQRSYQHALAEMDVAALHVTGWYDGDQPGALMNFPVLQREAKTERAREGQFLVVGPWGHAFNQTNVLGDVSFGPEGVIDLDAVVLRFFDRYLKGADNGMEQSGPVYTFTMGANEWRQSSTWPLPETQFSELYLDSDGAANFKDGDGALVLAPDESSQPDRFVYDPERLPYFPEGLWDDFVGEAATMDLSEWEDRDDELDYASEPLTAPIEITGPIEARLWVSTDGRDTDFAVALMRQEREGPLRHVAGGIQRVRYRKGNHIDAPVEPGEVVELTIDCWASSQRFEKGDRIVLKIFSSSFPGYARNMNTLEPQASATKPRVAKNTVYHDEKRPSHILLPVVVRDGMDRLDFAGDR